MREPGVDHVGRAAGKGEPRDVDIDDRAVRRGDDRIVTPAVERGVPGDVGCEGVADFDERRIGGKDGPHASPAFLLPGWPAGSRQDAEMVWAWKRGSGRE